MSANEKRPSKRPLDIFELHDTNAKIRRLRSMATGVDDVITIRASLEELSRSLNAAERARENVRNTIRQMPSMTVVEFVDASREAVQENVQMLTSATADVQEKTKDLRMQLQQCRGADDVVLASEDSDTDSSDEQHEAGQLDRFQQLKLFVNENDTFQTFIDELQSTQIMTTSRGQLTTLQASLESAQDSLDVCDGFFLSHNCLDSWVDFCSRLHAKSQAMMSSAETLGDTIEEQQMHQDIRSIGKVLGKTFGIVSSKCGICQEDKYTTFGCDSCYDATICANCYSDMIRQTKAQTNRAAMSRCLELKCVFGATSGCRGSYPKAAQKFLTIEALEALQTFKGEMECADQINAKFTREQRKLTEEMRLPFYDRLFVDESQRLARMVTNACPTCYVPFVDYDACAALTCPACSQKFCAMCLEACPRGMNDHEHVRLCHMAHIFGADQPGQIFLSEVAWKSGRAQIVNAQLVEYVYSLPIDGRLTDGQMLKAKLLSEFKKAEAPSLMPTRRRPVPLPPPLVQAVVVGGPPWRRPPALDGL
jgi:hypothetical protein